MQVKFYPYKKGGRKKLSAMLKGGGGGGGGAGRKMPYKELNLLAILHMEQLYQSN